MQRSSNKATGLPMLASLLSIWKTLGHTEEARENNKVMGRITIVTRMFLHISPRVSWISEAPITGILWRLIPTMDMISFYLYISIIDLVSSKLSMSSTLARATSPFIHLNSPERTFPGPTSINLRIDCESMVRIDSSHRTGALTCRIRSSLIFAPDV